MVHNFRKHRVLGDIWDLSKIYFLMPHQSRGPKPSLASTACCRLSDPAQTHIFHGCPRQDGRDKRREETFQFESVVLLLFFHNSNGQQNSMSVEFWWEKIEGNLRKANKEPSMHFRRANTEPSMHFRKANMKPSI